MENFFKAHFFNSPHELPAAVAAAAVNQIGFFPVEAPEFLGKGLGIEIDIARTSDVPGVELLGGADIQDDEIGV